MFKNRGLGWGKKWKILENTAYGGAIEEILGIGFWVGDIVEMLRKPRFRVETRPQKYSAAVEQHPKSFFILPNLCKTTGFSACGMRFIGAKYPRFGDKNRLYLVNNYLIRYKIRYLKVQTHLANVVSWNLFPSFTFNIAFGNEKCSWSN